MERLHDKRYIFHVAQVVSSVFGNLFSKVQLITVEGNDTLIILNRLVDSGGKLGFPNASIHSKVQFV